MSKFKDITRWLLAAGSAPAPDGKGTFHLYEKGNALSIKLWTGTQFDSASWVAEGVKSNSSAPCIFIGGKKVVFCIDKSDTIKCYAEPPDGQADDKDGEDGEDDEDDEDDEDLWKEVPLSPAGHVKAHPKSQLEASISPAGIMVFFQGANGRLSSLVNLGQGWHVVDTPASAEALPGTPLASFVSQGKLLLFYVGADNSVHFLTHQGQGNSWTDSTLASAKFGGSEPPSRITVAEGDEDAGLAVYCLTNGDRELAMVKASAKEVEVLGTVEKGQFQPAKGQEAVLAGWIWRPVPVFMDWMPYFWTPY